MPTRSTLYLDSAILYLSHQQVNPEDVQTETRLDYNDCCRLYWTSDVPDVDSINVLTSIFSVLATAIKQHHSSSLNWDDVPSFLKSPRAYSSFLLKEHLQLQNIKAASDEFELNSDL